MAFLNLKPINQALKGKSPTEIIDWALTLSDKKIATTSFGQYSAILLHAITKKDNDIDVVWCDTGYNTPETYEHAIHLINTLNLNINIYSPKLSKSVIDSTFGLPDINDPKHAEFTEAVKLEPFRRAIKAHNPNVWFTNIRINQTDHRNSKDILSFSNDGILKVSPFYYWTDDELDQYLDIHNLPKNDTYFDLTKVLTHRECGIHFQ